MLGLKCKILHVDLSSEKTWAEILGEDICDKFLGGKSLGYYLVYNSILPGTDPFDPENVIVFSSGLLNAVAPGASKVSVVSKSPLTGLIHDSHAGDFFGPLLRKAGYNALVIKGKAEKPVYLWINNDKVEIRRADHLWGLKTSETTDKIRSETSLSASVAAIGPAGERLVRFAHIAFDVYRAAGRGGLGAVMGSKNLKAVAVYGSNPVLVKDPDRLKLLRDYWFKHFSESHRYNEIRNYGTTNALLFAAQASMSPSYNFKKPWIPLEQAALLSGDAVKEKEIEAPWFIHGKSCPIKCARYVRAKYKGIEFEVKPEYENLGMLGAATGTFELDAVLYFNLVADELGIDTISAGNTIGWFLELVEEGLVNPEDYGVEAKGFGDAEAILRLLEDIAYRRGLGAILAEGVKRASRILGIGEEKAVHVKGLEAPAWDPRGRRTYGLSYATADVGASHLRGWPRPHQPPTEGPAKELVPSLIKSRDRDALLDTLGICRFVSYPMDAIQDFIEALTGTRPDEEYLLNAPRRAELLARIYAVKAGMIPSRDDTIPPRWMEPIPEGPLRGVKAFLDWNDFKEALKEYYRLRNWDPETGLPTPKAAKELDLPELIPEIKTLQSMLLTKIM